MHIKLCSRHTYTTVLRPFFWDYPYLGKGDAVAKQYNLVLAKGWWCCAAGKVIAGLVESNGSLTAVWMTYGHLWADCLYTGSLGPTSGIEYGKSLRFFTWVSRCQKKFSFGLYGAKEDNRGRHTKHLLVATLSGLISAHLHHPPFCLQARCPSSCPTISVKALKVIRSTTCAVIDILIQLVVC